MMDMIIDILKGSGINLLMTAIACVIAISVGAPLMFLSSKVKVCGKIFSWLSLPFECVSPIIMMLLVFYIPGMFGISFGQCLKELFGVYEIDKFSAMDREIAVIIALCISFIGYLPARFDDKHSFLRNLLYNGLGLVSTVLKWSFCARLLAVQDAVWFALSAFKTTASVAGLLLVAVFFGAFIIALEIGKRLVAQLMK